MIGQCTNLMLTFNSILLNFAGVVTSTGKFFVSLVIVSSHEDTLAILKILNFIKSQGVTPKYVMGDAAGSITKAVEDCWDDEPVWLMCWAHTTRAIDRSDYLKALRALDKDLVVKLMEDLDQLQWMVQNKASFRVVFQLFKEKYTKLAEDKKVDYPELPSAMSSFFLYMSRVWVESKEHKWYEGAHPWGPGHNQSIEGINKGVKENYTFRHKLEMGELFG